MIAIETELQRIVSNSAAIREAAQRLKDNPDLPANAGSDLAVIHRTAIENWDVVYGVVTDLRQKGKE